jgi:hypothetical protein
MFTLGIWILSVPAACKGEKVQRQSLSTTAACARCYGIGSLIARMAGTPFRARKRVRAYENAGSEQLIYDLRHMSHMAEVLLSDEEGWETWDAAVAAEDEQAVQVAAQPAAPPLAVPVKVPVIAHSAEQSPAKLFRSAAFRRVYTCWCEFSRHLCCCCRTTDSDLGRNAQRATPAELS